MTRQESIWIKFCPSLELPKERVSIAYDTHDERGYRFAYGYFQFYNGTCGCFWKDGNEQPKVVKAEDIKYWMPVPPLDVQEEPVSEDLMDATNNYCVNVRKGYPRVKDETDRYICNAFEAGANWQKQQIMKGAIEGYWIARDAPDILHPLRIHDNKIERKILDDGRKHWYCRYGDSINLPSNLFQEIQWESEPCKVKLLVLKEE